MSSLRDYLTEPIIANTILMQWQANKHRRGRKPIVLVEGDTDVRLYKRYLSSYSTVVAGNGKSINLNAIQHLASQDDGKDFRNWLLVICEADFDIINGIQHPDYVVMTDTHDIECEYLRSPALEKLTEESLADAQKTIHFSQKTDTEIANHIRMQILAAAKSIGHLRLMSIIKSLNLKFQGAERSKFIETDKSQNGIRTNLEKMVQVILSGGAPAGTLHAQIVGELQKNLAACTLDPWHLCQGHDLVDLLSIGFRRLWGKSNLKDDEISIRLRLAYEEDFLWKTSFGQVLKNKLEKLQQGLAV